MSDQTVDLAALVEEWFDWAAAAKALGSSVNQVRTMIREHQLAAAVPTPGAGQQIPAALIMDGEIVKGVPGLLTVLHDAGYDDREAIAWMFTDADLPGRPIDAMRENRGAEAKRRAQTLGF
ncbi:MAG TPA: Rv2175c family DNA-binding protein [Nocardioides sp.]